MYMYNKKKHFENYKYCVIKNFNLLHFVRKKPLFSHQLHDGTPSK